MLSFQSLVLLIALASAAMLAWNNWRAREHAERLARETCKRMGLQFLDDSVGMKKWRIVRDADPRTGLRKWAIRRVFQFEFSRQGSDRWPAELILLSGRLLGVEFNLVSDNPAITPPVVPRQAAPQDTPASRPYDANKVIPFKKPPQP
ncbi:MAG: DUF3301 domain-containing protein [Halothiobacillaceae bacterium]|nr:DUF3301 domain-containing protein [Halothiobacillaceae bacterium]